MSNPMDRAPFSNGGMIPPDNFMAALNQARQNPQLFEEQLRQSNPQAYRQAYRQACEIRNSANPREAIIQMARSRGINPDVLKTFGLI